MEVREGYKNTEVGVIPEEWEVNSLSKILKIRHGKSQYQVETVLGVYPILGTGGVIGYANEYLYNRPSVLIGRKGTINVPRYIDTPFWTIDTLFYSEISNDADPKYIYYLFQTIDWYQYNEASGVPSLNSKTIENIVIPIPQLSEQKYITEALSDVDNLISSINKLINKKKNIKQGAMQELLTGKKRLEGYSGEWEERSIWEVFDIYAGGDLNKNIFSSTKNSEYRYEVYSNALERRGIYGFSSRSKYPPNSITVTARGSIGYAIYRRNPFDAIGRLLVLIPKGNINCYFISEYINNRITFAIESTGVPQLTAPQISKYIIKFPLTKEEQDSIATILKDMDAEIEALEQKLNKYKAIKQGMMQELLTGRIRLV
ncbi:MAG: restriction endonuclease subunit S [Clostridiaceae bacterium]|nr:restriction endonuclease subunit S [Clostridiaceae bacterium]